LRECSEQLGHLGGGHLSADFGEVGVDEVLVAQGVDVRWELPQDDVVVAIDRQMLRRVLVNLVRNAAEAIRDHRPQSEDDARPGHVLVHARPTGEGVAIVVEDDGPGVPAASRERVFDPYFTTKADGTGLGLAIVKKIVVEHNGAIRAERSERLGGAAFVVTLPPPHSLAIAAITNEAGEPAPSRPAARRPAA
jgi:signal transduction histidine kinase